MKYLYITTFFVFIFFSCSLEKKDHTKCNHQNNANDTTSVSSSDHSHSSCSCPKCIK